MGKKGNQYWKLRTEDGRNSIWESPESLWKECLEYFKKTQKRKWNRIDFKGSNVTKVKIPTATPFSLTGLYLHLECNRQTFKNYEEKDGFLAVIERVRFIIETQQFEGAVVGAFNANIIARRLGLAEKTENKNYNYNSKELTKKEIQDYNETLEESY